MDNSSYSKAGDLLGGLMDLLGADGGSEIARLFQTWRSIVGDDIASHSAIEDIRNGTVIVVVDHPAWMQQIQFRQQHLLKRMQREFTQLEIKRILCKIGSPKIKPPVSPNQESPQNPAPQSPAVEPGDREEKAAPSGESTGQSENPREQHADKESFLASMQRLKSTLESQEPRDRS
ncbi:DUF721 domain-containing protein [Spirochaeta africana]|uniref:DUF721 domain-containing protein n=1 Tax=Spirochaeta africana (strain ATCC 700263 / DSM 8902 / Z-7692) TaxID=889378 RepID=H9UF21_SPIAZ|nr:DUF721 domain-containing protein [Spirochaeta africana]AFG36114.1 Protein of unknown function (DUF721) [Spirochaeta africana DSM 8902]